MRVQSLSEISVTCASCTGGERKGRGGRERVRVQHLHGSLLKKERREGRRERGRRNIYPF